MGTRDGRPAVARAILQQHVPDAVVTDISHAIEQNDLPRAAYLLQCTWRHYPIGTLHLLITNALSVSRRMILAFKDGHYFIAPDNGILPTALGPLAQVHMCGERAFTYREWLTLAARIATRIIADTWNKLPRTEPAAALQVQLPEPARDGIDCSVLYIDRFENVVLNMTRERFEQIIGERPFRIQLLGKKEITAVSHQYTDADTHTPLCRFNEAGYLEIAVNRGSAAAALALDQQGNNKALYYKTIRILF